MRPFLFVLAWIKCGLPPPSAPSLWDGLLSASDRILVLGATNRPSDIDSAILRRMPKRFAVGLPDTEQRFKILSLVRHSPLSLQLFTYPIILLNPLPDAQRYSIRTQFSSPSPRRTLSRIIRIRLTWALSERCHVTRTRVRATNSDEWRSSRKRPAWGVYTSSLPSLLYFHLWTVLFI